MSNFLCFVILTLRFAVPDMYYIHVCNTLSVHIEWNEWRMAWKERQRHSHKYKTLKQIHFFRPMHSEAKTLTVLARFIWNRKQMKTKRRIFCVNISTLMWTLDAMYTGHRCSYACTHCVLRLQKEWKKLALTMKSRIC